MAIDQANCMRRFIRMCDDVWKQGWHESSAGNLSYRLTDEDVRVCLPYLSVKGEGHEWVGLGYEAPEVAGEMMLVTAAGAPMRKVSIDPAVNCGIIEVDESGSAWRKVWGLRDGARPTSEIDVHILCHAALMRDTDGDNRVIYHAHTPNIMSLGLVIESDEKKWNRVLWGSGTEVIMAAPQGIGVIPWALPGSLELARRTADMIVDHDAVVWTQHGIVVREQNFDDSFGLAHTLEKAAGVYLHALAANGGAEPERLVSAEHLKEICDNLGFDFDEGMMS
jgi:rhamnulose-1-phosphate aldolase